jgi:CubicO group peptidase (beta-lactamase class C family)
MRLPAFFMAFFSFLMACSKSSPDPVPAPSLYFPPNGSAEWTVQSPTALGWNTTALTDLNQYLQSTNTKAFIILHQGKIVHEQYFDRFTQDSIWYWASAGKTATAVLVGIAQQQGLLSIQDPSSRFLGAGWTTAPAAKESLITIRHQLTMTTGLNEDVPNDDCTLPACLQYKADAGTRWYYHNAPYTLLDKVVETASGKTFNQYFREVLRDPIGMNGTWIKTPDANNVLYSNARSMARFGLLLLAKGQWNGKAILADQTYFANMTTTSQSLNQSYGYLTWLNGKSSTMLPGSSLVLPRSIIPDGPADLFAALGKNDQKIYVVPSRELVVIRMGNAAGQSLYAVSNYDNELWKRINAVIK